MTTHQNENSYEYHIGDKVTWSRETRRIDLNIAGVLKYCASVSKICPRYSKVFIVVSWTRTEVKVQEETNASSSQEKRRHKSP